MESVSGPICEVTFIVDREILDAFDAWLAQHLEETLHSPGVSGANVYHQEDDEQDHVHRIAHYYFFGDTELEQYLSGQAEDGSITAMPQFEGRVIATRRILRHTDIVDGELQPVEICPNCSTTLSGQYCGNCGQRASSRLISVWELLRDAFGDLLDVDSRIWRTLVPLLIRPGRLTRDYLEGRRARYMPPFRMYLVLSIVFFLAAFFNPREELGFLFEPAPESASQAQETRSEADEAREELLRDLSEDGIIVGGGGSEEEAGDDEVTADSNELTISISSDGELDENCEIDELEMSDWPVWLSSRLTAERLKVACDKVVADDGRAFVSKLLDNVPAALFLLLPLMALVLKVLYPLSKRYYVEHLLFVLHYHAFFFLLLSLQALFARLGSQAGMPHSFIDFTTVVVSLYIPAYLYKALRRVYEQGHLLTMLKFLILLLAYFVGLLVVLGLVALIAAFSI